MPVNRLRWKDWSTSEQGQRLYRSLEPIDTSNLPPVYATFPPNVEYFEDPNVEVGKNYHYIVSAFKDGIEKFSDPLVIDTGVSPLGPGPDQLIGNNETCGFFGEIPHTELINTSDLAALVGLHHGTNISNSPQWLKFILDGKILFVSKTGLRYNITWNMLDQCNAITGNKIVYIKGYAFRIRLLTGLNPDTNVAFSNNSYDDVCTHGSEWNRLIYNVTYVSPSFAQQKNSQVGEDWAAYSTSEIANSSYSYTICQESSPRHDGSCILRGNNSYITYMNEGSKSSTGYNTWRPVLELVTT